MIIIISIIVLLSSFLLAGLCIGKGLDAKFKDNYDFDYYSGNGFSDIYYPDPNYASIAKVEKESKKDFHSRNSEKYPKPSKTFIMKLFIWTVKALYGIGKVFNLTYTSVNIIIWYMLLPLIWAMILDYKFHQCIISPLWLLFCLGITILERKKFNQYCDTFFRWSQMLILSFGNYFLWSVILCLVVPLVITIALIII